MSNFFFPSDEVLDFSEVPTEMLEPDARSIVISHLWNESENIIVLEAQGLLHSVRYACEHSPPCRLLFFFFFDNLGLVLAAAKVRTTKFVPLVTLRKNVCAFTSGNSSSSRGVSSRVN